MGSKCVVSFQPSTISLPDLDRFRFNMLFAGFELDFSPQTYVMCPSDTPQNVQLAGSRCHDVWSFWWFGQEHGAGHGGFCGDFDGLDFPNKTTLWHELFMRGESEILRRWTNSYLKVNQSELLWSSLIILLFSSWWFTCLVARWRRVNRLLPSNIQHPKCHIWRLQDPKLMLPSHPIAFDWGTGGTSEDVSVVRQAKHYCPLQMW